MTAASTSAMSVSGSSGGNADGDGGEQAVSTGDRISVYWTDDGKWYDGRVHSQVAAGWWVHYDDGDKQVHDLRVERYKVQGAQASKPPSSVEREEGEKEDDDEEVDDEVEAEEESEEEERREPQSQQRHRFQGGDRGRGGTSKYRGVCWHKAERKWRAQITHGGQKRHLSFGDEAAAARAYDAAQQGRRTATVLAPC